jgi:dolichyl-phosphate-mannose--protein O-mannosyl transferase
MQNFWKINKEKILLLLIILLGFYLRLYNINWDQGNHLHPDERAIVMFTLPLQFPSNIFEFLSTNSPLNPHFFAYGSLPLYLLKAIGAFAGIFYPQAASYDQINLIGRAISAIFDVGTLLIIFLLGKRIFSKQIGLLGAFFYAISVFPIQASHFYAVDIPLTFFIMLTLYLLILFYLKPTRKKAILIGILFGISLATKTSALVLVISIGAALISDFILIFIKNPHRPHIWFPHVPKFLKTLLV